MTYHISQEEPRENRRGRLILLAAILVAGALCAWWLAARADHQMREDLLDRTRLVAKAVNIERVQALSGTEADLESPDYLRLKEQFAAVRVAEPKCRFVYLTGQKPDGTVYFFADSEPVWSKDESPAGQVYEEVSAEYLRAFETSTELVEGPVEDRWGTWISALVPLTNPQTGELIAILGMDIDATNWKWDVAANAALPVGLVLLIMIGVVAALIGSGRPGRKEAELKPVQRRLLIPLATGMKRHGLALAALWTLIVAVSMTWNGVSQWRAMHEVAANGARTNFFKDVIYRRWNAELGGVYAEITDKNQPNPYLEVKEREIETPSGRRLTLVNPAYMTRQVH
ncbi:MAG: hypothetical protein U9R02_13980, partial [Thermodesulfobacteriota bacterium]|nr:hypothetical protein [Thermodesulfobacteriota bacterium]